MVPATEKPNGPKVKPGKHAGLTIQLGIFFGGVYQGVPNWTIASENWQMAGPLALTVFNRTGVPSPMGWAR